MVKTGKVEIVQASLDATHKLGNGVTVKVTRLEPVKGTAHGPGEIGGPALRVTVHVDNGTTKPVDLGNTIVNLYYGKAKTPASALSGPGVVTFNGSVPAGASASGTYVFGVPTKARDLITVEFSYSTKVPTIVFIGKP